LPSQPAICEYSGQFRLPIQGRLSTNWCPVAFYCSCSLNNNLPLLGTIRIPPTLSPPVHSV